MRGLRFQPRLLPGLGVIAGVALFVYLGLWQSGKAQVREAEIAQHEARGRQGPFLITTQSIDSTALQDAPVSVRGRFAAERQFYIDNRQEGGKPGLHVITPLRISGGDQWILVNRGWVGWGATRGQIPPVAVPDGEVEVQGVAALPSTKKFFLMPEREDSNARLWTRLDLERYAKQYPEPVQPLVILQVAPDATDGLVRRWPPPEDRVAMHKSYALQWFGMALALVIFYFAASLRKRDGA